MEKIISIAARLPKSTLAEEKPTATVPQPIRIVDADVCPQCKGLGWLRRNVPLGHPDFGKAVQCQCQAVAAAKRALSKTYTWLGTSADVASELEAMTFNSFDPRANGESVALAYKRTRGYAEMLKAQVDGQKNGLFIGPLGVGKTHLACSVLNVVRLVGIGCLFASGNELFQRLYDSDFDESILKQAAETQVLCLDDLDKMQVVKDGSYQKTTLFNLFNARYVAKRPTIITANVDDDWRQWLHPAILSRMFGKDKVEAIGIQGRDFRMGGIRG